jgi:hypothetical protein
MKSLQPCNNAHPHPLARLTALPCTRTYSIEDKVPSVPPKRLPPYLPLAPVSPIAELLPKTIQSSPLSSTTGPLIAAPPLSLNFPACLRYLIKQASPPLPSPPLPSPHKSNDPRGARCQGVKSRRGRSMLHAGIDMASPAEWTGACRLTSRERT